MLTRVTITGADDAVDPNALVALSAEFPFVEWGILLSHRRMNTARYPSILWLRKLRETTGGRSRKTFVLAYHLCGSIVREAMDEAYIAWPVRGLASSYLRLQLNGYQPGSITPALEALRDQPLEMILQCGSESALPHVARDARILSSHVLFGLSGGTGSVPSHWPVTPAGTSLGFAGGIGPDNVVDVLNDIGPREAPFWIDMESGVRTNDRFDLAKVRAVLEAAKPFVSAG
jgi:hypothetical protein